MTELKTLKDLEIRRPKGIELPYLDWYNEALKQEAIKWIKEISKGGFDTRPNVFDMPVEIDETMPEFMFKLVNDSQRKLMKAETDIVVRWIRFFFNITEEDVK